MLRVIVGCELEEAQRVRALVVRAYDEARKRNWPFLSDVLDGAARSVTEEERAILAATVQALVKYDRLLGFACGAPSSEARFESLLALVRGETNLDGRLSRIESETERLGTEFSIPDWIVDVVRAELGPDALRPTLSRMNETAPRVARVNTLATTREACLVGVDVGHRQDDTVTLPASGLQVGVVTARRNVRIGWSGESPTARPVPNPTTPAIG